MPELTYRGNLSASTFPMVSNYQGRTCIVPGIDQNFVRGLQANPDGLVDDASRGVPQIQYAHNVMPSVEGFQSVGFTQRVGAAAASTALTSIFPVKELPAYLTLNNVTGLVWVLNQSGLGVWQWTAATVGAPAGDIVRTTCMTYAIVNGITYFLLNADVFGGPFANPCRTLDAFFQFNTVVLTGAAAVFGGGKIRGNASCFGYHILYNDSIIAWSSTTNPLDFTPSLVSGAGFAQVEGARGKIVSVVSHQLGLIIYTTANAVAAIYTGNARYPFQFKEITGVGGFPDFDLVSSNADNLISDDANTNSHYSYTSSGLQLINTALINTVLPDITDFISGLQFEDFNTGTLLFSRTTLTQQMYKGINTIADRYLVISYGTVLNTYTHALVYDLINKRMGKIKINHVYAFTLQNTAIASSNAAFSTGPRGAIAFMQNNGTIFTVDFNPTASVASDSVIIIGKFQTVRERMLQLQRIDLENIQAGAAATLYVYSSLDGKNPLSGVDTAAIPVAATLNQANTNLRTWRYHTTGINHSICLIGAFYLTSLVLKFNNAGRR